MHKIDAESMKILEITYQPLVDLKEIVDGMTAGEKHDTSSFMNTIVIRVATMAEYIEQRRDGNDHQGAVKKAIQVRRRVRKAMGYTFGDDGLSSF